MPHIIVEHPKQRVIDTQVDAMLNAIHHAIVESDLYKPGQQWVHSDPNAVPAYTFHFLLVISAGSNASNGVKRATWSG